MNSRVPEAQGSQSLDIAARGGTGVGVVRLDHQVRLRITSFHILECLYGRKRILPTNVTCRLEDRNKKDFVCRQVETRSSGPNVGRYAYRVSGVNCWNVGNV